MAIVAMLLPSPVPPHAALGARPPCPAGLLRLGQFQYKLLTLPQKVKLVASPSAELRQRSPLRATAQEGDFDLKDYVEARIDAVKHAQAEKTPWGSVVMLKLMDGNGGVLPLYIGEAECSALVTEMSDKPRNRPLTHDVFKTTLEVLGYKVAKVRVTALVGNTYHARVHFARGKDNVSGEHVDIDVDARPSDAINLAIRFAAPIYVNKDVAAKMAQPAVQVNEESHAEIRRSCREEVLRFDDPTVMHKLHLQVAIKEERYADAAALQCKLDKLLACDRALSLVVAMDAALADERFEEAARLRDEFRRLQRQRAKANMDA